MRKSSPSSHGRKSLPNRISTTAAINQTTGFYSKQPQVDTVVAVKGFSFFGQGQSTGITFATLHPWDERKGEEQAQKITDENVKKIDEITVAKEKEMMAV